tara:strand:- start:217 stop:1053 length:837 start_codon:yes stop_codon:yes gene_type:complete
MSWLNDIKEGKRFRFGSNWKDFVENNLNEESVKQAISCTKTILDESKIDIKDKTVVDIGCGSGLFSLVALELGAKYVMSFDFDPESVNCTNNLLRSRNFDEKNYKCTEGNILDEDFIKTLGKYDFVYSWGVLHHTGDLYQALSNASLLAENNGLIFLSLYQKTIFDPLWRIEKKFFSSSSKNIQLVICKIWIILLKSLYTLKGKSFKKIVANYFMKRGMNFYNDLYDWLGGYPYEGIDTKDCVKFFNTLGFINILLKKRSKYFAISSGCNEYIFSKAK